METLIAILIFSLTFTMLAATFSSFLKNYNETKKSQRAIENAQYAMNLMAKTLRTSTLSGSPVINSFPLVAYDHSQGICIEYSYDAAGHKLQFRQSNAASDCASAVFGNPVADLTQGNIAGASINAIATDNSTYPATLGRVTILLEISKDPDSASKTVPVQMSVSLRQ